MSDEQCNCGSSVDVQAASPAGPHWVGDSDPVGATLPDDYQQPMERFLGVNSVETFAEFSAALHSQIDSGALGVENLCHADEPTGHRASTAEETYHFQCFYDAVVLAELVESPVEIRTETPGGEIIEVHADGSGAVTATPEDAVMSFGVHRNVESPAGDESTMETAYSAICPFVKTFPDRERYEAWAHTVPAATVGMELTDATGIAGLLATGERDTGR